MLEDAALSREHEADLLQLTALLRLRRPLWLHGAQGAAHSWLMNTALAADPLPTTQLHAVELYGASCVWTALDGLPRGPSRLVLWEAHRLIAHEGLLALLARISSLPGREQVAIAFVSVQAPPVEALGGAELLSMCIAPYSRTALVSLVKRLERPVAEAEHAELFDVFVDLLAATHLTAERDLVQLRQAVRLLWPVFIAPLHTEALASLPAAERAAVLAARVSAPLSWYGPRLFQREVSCTERRRARAVGDHTASTPLLTRDLELPHMAKLLLIAAYLAAHLPPSADTRLFSRQGALERAPVRRHKRGAPTPASIAAPSGPRPFRVERMRAIAVLLKGAEIDAAHNVELASAVASLVHLGLLRSTSPATSASLHATRLRCLAPRQLIEEQCCPVWRIQLCDYLARP